MQPVTNIQTVAIDGQLFPLHRTNHHKGNELLGELERTIVVRAARDRHGYAVGARIRLHEEVGSRL